MTTTITSIERMPRPRLVCAALPLVALLLACGAAVEEAPREADDSWSVTAWGERFEVFPEVDGLVAGRTAVAHTHVTRLEGFSPVVDGTVQIVLAGSTGEQVFSADSATRPGIFAVEIAPSSEGEFDLLFRIREGEVTEEITAGRVRVGSAARPGGVVVAPAPKGAIDGGEPVDFLKEQQWRSDFSTAWVRSGALPASVGGFARVRPPAGGEATVTAPVDGVVEPPQGRRGWPYPGQSVARAGELFRLSPLVAPDRSLPALEAEVATLDAELETARARASRLEDLLALEAASRREVEEVQTLVATLEARRSAAAEDLDGARAARQSGAAGSDLILRAPFDGGVSRVLATPGATVSAGEALARVVRTDVVWIEVLLSPADARRLASHQVRGVVLTDPEAEPLRLEEGVRRVAVAPEMNPETGTVSVLLEVPAHAGLSLGASLEARVLMVDEVPGIVVPSSALVDDGGITVAYLQLSGESFVRQEIHVPERQGDLVLVEGLVPGQRLVTRGGDAIRRSTLMTSGEAQGHVH